MRYNVRHQTTYAYQGCVSHAHHLLHLVPRPAPYQQCLEHSIEIAPDSCRRREEIDAFGNPVTRIELTQPHDELAVTSQMQVVVHARPALRAADSVPWERCRTELAYDGRWPAREGRVARRVRHE